MGTVVDYGRAGLSAAGEMIGEAVETGGEVVSGVVGSVRDMAVALIEQYAPGALAFLRGLGNYVSEQVSSGFDSIFGGFTERIRNDGLAGAFEYILIDLAGGALGNIGSLVAGACSSMGETAGFLLELGAKLGGEAIQAIREGAGAVAAFFNDLWTKYGAPAAEALSSFAGSIWNHITETVSGWWDELAPVREFAQEAWDWLVSAYLAGRSALESFLQGLFQAAVEKWDEIKKDIKPFMPYVVALLAVLSLFTPMGPFVTIGAMAYGLYRLVSFLWQIAGQPLVQSIRRTLAEDVLPAILAGIDFVKEKIEDAKTWLSGLVDQVSALAVALLTAIGAIPYLRLARAIISQLSEQLQQFADTVKAKLEELATAVGQFLQSAYQFIQPILEFLRQTLLIVLLGPFAILDDGVWNTVQQIAQFAMTVPCIREIADLIRLPDILMWAEEFRAFMKNAWEIIQNPEPILQAIHDALEPMAAQVPTVAASIIAEQIYPDEQEHRLGVQRHLEPAIEDFQNKWWEELKHMGWTLIWPWDEVSRKIPTLIESGSEAISAIFDLEIGTAIDKLLAAKQDLDAILGALWGWFAIASVLIGGLLGALGVEFSGTATLWAGMGAGWAFAGTVGLVLLAGVAVTQLGIIAKAMFDVRYTNQTIQDESERLEENDKDYGHIANSTFTLAVVTALVILGIIAQKIASAIWKRVRPRGRPGRGRSRIQRVGEAEGVTEVPTDMLQDIHSVPRRGVPEGHIDSIAQDIAANGYDVGRPVSATQLPNGDLIVTGGHHRLAAMRMLGEHTVPTRIYGYANTSAERLAYFLGIGRTTGRYTGEYLPRLTAEEVQAVNTRLRQWRGANPEQVVSEFEY